MTSKKKNPVKTVFATSFFVSLAFFSTFVAFNLDRITCYFGSSPCINDTRPRYPMKNNAGINDNPAKYQSFSEYLENTIFIGDSRTNGLIAHHVVKPYNIYAEDGENHQSARTKRFIDLGTGRLLTIAEAVSITKPERMIVSFGINGVAFMSSQVFLEQYDAFIGELKTVSPDSLIIIQSILPVSYSRQISYPNMTNDKIDSYNFDLKLLAEQKGCRYWDTSSLLKNSLNCLSAEFDSGDGLHFSNRAYDVLLDELDRLRISKEDMQ